MAWPAPIDAIRALGNERLNRKGDASIDDLYTVFQRMTEDDIIEPTVEDFVRWATTSPCDGYVDAS